MVDFIEKTEIRYGWRFSPLKMLKYGTNGDLFHLKCQNKVQLGIYFIENDELRYGWAFIPENRPK